MAIADDDVSFWVARMKRERLGREADFRLDEFGIESHSIRIRIDVGARVAKNRFRLGMKDVDPDFPQYG